MAKGRLENGQRIVAAAERDPNCTRIRRGKGSHTVVYGRPGTRPVPVPQRDLSKREQCRIDKQLRLAGIVLSVTVFACLALAALAAVL